MIRRLLVLAACLALAAPARADPWVAFGTAVQVAVPSGTHSAGSSVGGLISIPLAARIQGGRGELRFVGFKSFNGDVIAYLVRIWSRLPAATTCTDAAAFVSSTVDDAFLVENPFTVTPAAPSQTTGDGATYASQTGAFGFVNSDLAPSTSLYMCIVASGAGDTADPAHTVQVTLAGAAN